MTEKLLFYSNLVGLQQTKNYCFMQMLDSKDLMVEISVTILIPASIVHIGKRHKISRCFMMYRRSNVVYVQYLLKI